MFLPLVLSVLAAAPLPAAGAEVSMPHLRRQGTAIQLVVDGKPFLIRGGNGYVLSASFSPPPGGFEKRTRSEARA
jgi:hypothetical protein